jgi:hypothetical protein
LTAEEKNVRALILCGSAAHFQTFSGLFDALKENGAAGLWQRGLRQPGF